MAVGAKHCFKRYWEVIRGLVVGPVFYTNFEVGLHCVTRISSIIIEGQHSSKCAHACKSDVLAFWCARCVSPSPTSCGLSYTAHLLRSSEARLITSNCSAMLPSAAHNIAVQKVL